MGTVVIREGGESTTSGHKKRIMREMDRTGFSDCWEGKYVGHR